MTTRENGFTEEESEKIKSSVLARLKRIEGQVRGIQRMVEAGKECESILTQVRAVRSALQSANSLILKRFLMQCYTKSLDEHSDPEEALHQAIKILATFSDN